MPKTKPKMVPLFAEIPSELKKRLDRYLAETDAKQKAVVAAAIVKFLDTAEG